MIDFGNCVVADTERERRFQAIIESAIDFAIIATDTAGKVTDWNPGAKKILGWSAEDIEGEPLDRIFTPEDQAAGRPELEMATSLQDGAAPDERWHMRADGTRFWANGELMVLRSDEGEHLGFVKILRDRTAQHEAAASHHADAEFLRSVLASSADCIKVLDLDANLIFMSEGGQRVMEVSDFDTIRGCAWPDFWKGDGNVSVRAAIASAKAGGTGRFQGGADTHLGNARWWDVQVTPIFDEDGRPEQLLAISRDITATRLADEALRNRETFWHDLFDRLAEGFILGELVRDVAGRVTDWRYINVNPAWGELVGVPPAAAVGNTIRQLFPGIEDARVTEMADVVTSGTPATFIRAVGTIGRWYEGRAFPLDGDRFGVLCLEITERLNAEERVRVSELEFRTVSQAMPNHVWTSPPDGTLDWFNDQVYAYSGGTLEQLVAGGWTSLVHPDDIAAAAERWSASLDSGATYEAEFRIRRHDGAYRWHIARALPVKNDADIILRWIGTNTDIHAQKLVEAETLRDRDRLWTLSRDLLLVCDFTGVITAINPTGERLLGWSEAEMLGSSIADFLHPDDLAPTAAEIEKLGAGETTLAFKNRYRSRAGTYRVLDWTAVPEDSRIHAVGRDITEEMEAAEALAKTEEALRQSQKMEAVGQLTGGIAHDFNNLLTGISGSLEMLQIRIAQGRMADVDKYVNGAQGAARRAAALTHRLLAFSRRQTLAPKSVAMNQLVGGMQDLIQRTVGPEIEIEVVGAGGLWNTLVDPSQLENALLNLCINARDAMMGGGKLTIETANRWLDERAARELDIPAGQYLSLCVSDTGTGMPPEVINKAFDPFFTTKPLGEGTGLGLSMIYGFARQSNGQVRIYSEIDQGTMVCIYLPRYIGEAEGAEDTPELSDIARAEQGETVLIVDDEPTVRMLVTEILEDLGYTAIEAADGAAGLKVLQSDARVDLLITDVGLPGGMNGRQVADAARTTRPGLKVLFITGYAENAVLSYGHLDPGMHILTKPFSLDALASRIRGLIEG